MAAGFPISFSSIGESNDFVVLGSDGAESLYLMSLVARASQSDSQLLAGRIDEVTRRCGGLHTGLTEFRCYLERLRHRVAEQLGQLAEQRQQLTEKERQLDCEMAHYAEREGGRLQLTSDLLKLKAEQERLTRVAADHVQLRSEHSLLCKEMERLQQLQAEATKSHATAEADLTSALEMERRNRRADVEALRRAHRAELEAETSKTLAKLEALTKQQKQLRQMEARSERQVAEMTDLVGQLSSRTVHHQEICQMQQMIDELQLQLQAKQTECDQLRPFENEVAELRREVERLRIRDDELTRRCEECERTVLDVLTSAESDQRRLQREVKALHDNQKEALEDYANKMKEKATAEFLLREQIEDLTAATAELQKQLDDARKPPVAGQRFATWRKP